MRSTLPVTALQFAAPLSAPIIVFDPHLDLPQSALAPGWTGLADPTASQIWSGRMALKQDPRSYQ